jgi:DNA-binding protein HU-beta
LKKWWGEGPGSLPTRDKNTAWESKDDEEALDAFISSVSISLKAGKEVRVVGFGSFVPIKRPAGTARNPRTGETVNRKASQTCRFRVGDTLKMALNA